MKRLLILLFVLSAVGVYAQIGVKLESNHPVYLRYEPVKLKVTLTNLAGNTLVFGGNKSRESGRLVFNVSRLTGRFVRHLDLDANPMTNLIMAPGESKVLYLKLNSLFDLQAEDTYFITAIVSHSRLEKRYQSEKLSIDIRDGLKMESRSVGLPSAGANDMIQMLNFILIRFNDTNGSLYCLRAEDEQKVYGTFRIGPFINGGMKPQMEVENGNVLHVFLQVAPRLYCYTTYSIAKGDVRKRQEVYYCMAGNAAPHLGRETGFLKVHNVRLARKGRDYNKEEVAPFEEGGAE